MPRLASTGRGTAAAVPHLIAPTRWPLEFLLHPAQAAWRRNSNSRVSRLRLRPQPNGRLKAELQRLEAGRDAGGVDARAGSSGNWSSGGRQDWVRGEDQQG